MNMLGRAEEIELSGGPSCGTIYHVPDRRTTHLEIPVQSGEIGFFADAWPLKQMVAVYERTSRISGGGATVFRHVETRPW